MNNSLAKSSCGRGTITAHAQRMLLALELDMAKIDFGFDHFLKLLVVGGDDSSRVGKSSFVRTFCEGVFPPLLNTTDLDSKCSVFSS